MTRVCVLGCSGHGVATTAHLPVRAGVPRPRVRAAELHGVGGADDGATAAASASRAICACVAGWGGGDCSERRCPRGCEKNGVCRKDGVCECLVGWGGEAPRCASARRGARATASAARASSTRRRARRTPSARASRGGGRRLRRAELREQLLVERAVRRRRRLRVRRRLGRARLLADPLRHGAASASPSRRHVPVPGVAPRRQLRAAAYRIARAAVLELRRSRRPRRAAAGYKCAPGLKGEDCSLMDTWPEGWRPRGAEARTTCRRSGRGRRRCASATPAGAGRRATRSCATAGATAAACARTTRAGASPGWS